MLHYPSMGSAEKLGTSMRPGSVYRRRELSGRSTAIDRDLKTLVDSGDVKKLAWGLYYRPCKKLGSALPPGDRQLVRAFLKTNDFSILSGVVYNHKRAGHFLLGGRRFEFHVVRSYPTAPEMDGTSVAREPLPIRIVSRKDERSDLGFWLGKPAGERVGAVESLREQYYALSGYKSLPALAHSAQVRPRET